MTGVFNNSNACVVGNTTVLVGLTHDRRGQLTVLRTTLLLRFSSPSCSEEEGSERKDPQRDDTAIGNNHSGDENEVFILPVPNNVPRGGRTRPQEDAGHYSLELHDISYYPDVLSVCRECFDLDPACNGEEEAASQAENSLLDNDDNEEDEPEDEEDDATLHSDEEDDEEDDDTEHDLSDEEAKAFTVGSPAAKQRHDWHRHPLGLQNGVGSGRHIPTSYLTFTKPKPQNSGRESEDVHEISYNSTEYWDALAGEEVLTPQLQRHHQPQQPSQIYAVQSLKELLHVCAYKGEHTDKQDDEQKEEEFVDIPLQDNDKDKVSEEEFNAEVQRNEQLDDYGSDTEVEFDKEVELELERRRRLRRAKQKRQETNSSNGSSKNSQVDERKYQSFSLSAEARDQLERYSTGYGFIVCLLGTKSGSRIGGGTTDADVFSHHSFFRKVSLLLAYTHPAFNGETLHIPFVAYQQPHQHHQHHSTLKSATTSLTVYSVNTDVEDGGLSLAQVNRDHYQQLRFKRQNKLRELERDLWEKARQREEKTMLTTKQQQRRANGDNKTAQDDILEEDKMVWFNFGNLIEFFKEGVITEAEYLTRKRQLLESLASNKLLAMESGSGNNDNNQASAITVEIPPELEHTTRVWKHLRLAKLEVDRLPVRMMPLYELRRRHLSSQQLLLFNNKEHEGKDSRRAKKEERVSSKWKLSGANRMLYKAQKLERQKELSKAKELYERILRTQQDHPYAHFAFAKFLSRYRRCKLPEREESGRGRNRERGQRYNREEVRRRRILEAQQQQQQKAIALFERAVKLDPFQGEVLGHYAFFLETVLRDTDKAHRFYKRCLFADPHNLANLCNYAVFLKNVLGENVQAERFYLKAIQLSGGKHVDSLGNYALFLWRVYKSFEDADFYFIKALRQAMDERNYRMFSNNSAKQQKDVHYWRDQYRTFLEETGTRAMGDRQVILLLGKDGRRQERRKREDEEKSRGDRERGRERRRHERTKESERIRPQRRADPAPSKRTEMEETNNQVNEAEVGRKHENENARESEEAKMHRLREEQRLATLQKEEEKINAERTIGRKDKLFISSVICLLWQDEDGEKKLNAKAEEDGELVEENAAPSSPVALPPPFTYFCQHRMNEGVDGEEESFDATSKTAPEVIARMERLLERQGARKHLCSVLNDQRTNTMEIAAEAFPVLCRFLWVALHYCDTQMDFTSAKECMHMACTFYTVITSNSNSNSSGDSDGNECGGKDSSQQNTNRTMMESLRRFYSSMDTRKNGDDGEKKQEEGERSDNNKLYVQDTLKAAAIWKNEDYWSTAFYEQMFYERNKLGLIVTGSGSWSGFSEEERSDLLKTEENITFGLLGSFSHNMLMAGVPKTNVMSFVSKQCLANGLDECQSAPLLERISSWPSQ